MPWPASPLAGKTTDWRAGCGKSARPVRREGEPKPISSPYPYHPLRMMFMRRRWIAGSSPAMTTERMSGRASSLISDI